MSSGRPSVTLANPGALEQVCSRSHFEPCAELKPYISVAWTMQWSLGDGDSFPQKILPNPCVHLVVNPDAVEIVGVVTGAFSITLSGSGFVFGLKFRPGGFYPFAKRPVSEMTDRRFAVQDFFPSVDEQRLRQFAASFDGRALMDYLETAMRNAEPAHDPELAQVSDITDRLATDGTVLCVEDAARIFGISVRSLQRLFRTYVGVGPKWVIRRYRLQEAAARVDAGGVENWAELARELGYFDQAHFINEFTRFLGNPPGEYSRSGTTRR